VLFEVVFRKMPFEGFSPVSVPLKVASGVRPTAPVPENADMLGQIFSQLCALMEACWHKEPAHRPPFEHVLAQLEWMAEDHSGQEDWEGAVIFPAGEERLSMANELTVSEAVRQGYCISYSDLELGYKIGEGNYGTVFEGMYLSQKVAVKQLFVDGFSDRVLEEFHKEVGRPSRIVVVE
jgi:hypothetical protein